MLTQQARGVDEPPAPAATPPVEQGPWTGGTAGEPATDSHRGRQDGPMRSTAPSLRERAFSARSLFGRVAASVATVAVAGGLMGFAHFGSFGDGHDPFPRSVVAHT
jgi:hypothetical protein